MRNLSSMRRWPLAMLALLCLAGCRKADEVIPLVKYIAPGAQYSVATPGPLQTAAQERRYPWGTLREETLHTTHRGVVLAVSAIQLPASINAELRREPRELVLARGRDGLLQQLNGRLQSERPVMLDGRPDGREIIAELEQPKARLIARVYWVRTTLFQIRVLLPLDADAVQQRLARDFLDSLKIAAKRS